MEEVPPPFLYEGGTYMEQLEIMEGILNAYPYPIVFVDNDYIIRGVVVFKRLCAAAVGEHIFLQCHGSLLLLSFLNCRR